MSTHFVVFCWRRPLAAVSAAALFGVAGPMPSSASEPPEPSASTLDRVTVIAHRPDQGVRIVLDPRASAQPAPASDGADHLKRIPGFNAIRNGGSNGDPVLRGMFGSRLNILSNDGAMPGACPSRMDNPLSYVAPETYERLTVIKGPQTVRWGPGGSAGTIRFERQPPRLDVASAIWRGSLLGGRFGRNDQAIGVVAGDRRGYARVDANRSQADDYTDGGGRVVPSRWSKWNADIALGWTPDAETRLELRHGSGDGRARYAGRGMDGARFRRDSDGLLLRKRIGDAGAGGIEASIYRNAVDHLMDNYSLRTPDRNGLMPMASNVRRNTAGGRAALDWTGAGIEWNAGLDVQRSDHRIRNAPGRGGYRQQPWRRDARMRHVGLFFEAERALGAHDRLFAGARLDRARTRDLRPTIGDRMMPRPNPTHRIQRKVYLNSGFLRWERSMQARGGGGYLGIGRAERMPDYWESFSAAMGPAGAANAFAAVRPERTTQLDAGLQWRSAYFDAWASIYLGRIDDYILFRYHDGGMMGMTSQALNIDADIRGGEAGLRWRPAMHWMLEASLAHAWGENRSDRRALPQMPPLESRIGLSWDDGRWSAGLLLRAVRGQDRVAPAEGNVVGRDFGPSAGFAVVSLNGGYRLGPALRLSAGIDNLFGRDHSEHLNLAGSADFGYPAEPVRIQEPGRNLWLKLSVDTDAAE